jgi:hypothetical protein
VEVDMLHSMPQQHQAVLAAEDQHFIAAMEIMEQMD